MDRPARLPWWFLIANWSLTAAALFLGVKIGERLAFPTGLVGELPKAQLEALAIVCREVRKSHVDPHDGDALLEAAIGGMVRALDPYSRYVPPAEVADYEEQNTGAYVGIGADFRPHGDDVVLRFPLAGGPADRAGLQPGDVLLAVDDVALATPELRARFAERVRGAAGTTVRLRLRRGDDEFEVALARGEVHRPCVAWAHRLPGEDALGYLHVTDFQPDAAEEAIAAIDALLADGPLRGLLIDLRGNGGGSLDACVELARAFVPSGLIVSQARRGSEVVERYEAKPERCRFPTVPIALLVDADSASASEVLAGALQDHGRAVVVGERTHGKGCVNTIYAWQDRPFRLKLTTGRYRTPNGRDIERRLRADDAGGDETAAAGDGDAAGGIAPDVAASLPAERRAPVRAALRQPEPPLAHRAAVAALCQGRGERAPAPPRAGDDPQLAAAIAALRARAAAVSAPK
jgi:carboxyl-terminal processing protease